MVSVRPDKKITCQMRVRTWSVGHCRLSFGNVFLFPCSPFGDCKGKLCYGLGNPSALGQVGFFFAADSVFQCSHFSSPLHKLFSSESFVNCTGIVFNALIGTEYLLNIFLVFCFFIVWNGRTLILLSALSTVAMPNFITTTSVVYDVAKMNLNLLKV